MLDTLAFGTDGWRDRIGERFTVANVRRAAQATADGLRRAGEARVVVAHDTRFGGPMFARAAAETLAGNGLTVLLHEGPLPTPALSFAVRQLGAGAGVMLTASHNPPLWNGFKLKGPYGGSATQEMYASVARATAELRPEDAAAFDATRHEVERFEIREAYFAHLAGQLDLDVLRSLQGTLVHDAMGGAAGGWIREFARYARLRVTVEQIRGRPDPLFYGSHPEPIPAHMGPLAQRMRRGDALLGVATDGDGDRLAGILPGGRALNSHEIFALLLDRAHRTGARGRVVKTVTVSRLIERLAERRGLAVVETPVGFKHLVNEMLAGDVLIAGEESGGIGLPDHLLERDGIANTLFLLSVAAEGRVADGEAAGGVLATRLDALQEEAEWQHAYDRADLALTDEEMVRVEAALGSAPTSLDGRAVTGVERRDGVKLNLSGKAWLLVRASGTEPLVRIYCEAQSEREVAELLRAGTSWATGRAA